ncbi:hypothetical protein FSP39_019059 [Pinctada imbricata]|uniref:Uncharacterized protein n=1 Tax=Pinctada imbricata TaxID=66713 RepID=A0AA88YK23_PINIB|nr:hypothetical protein FSP39_019059 [Pinctada imbricata]
MEELAKHGITLPPNMMGLTDEQVEELKLKDEWEDKCVPQGGFKECKDQIGRRNGKAPKEKMAELLNKTVKEAKDMISKSTKPPAAKNKRTSSEMAYSSMEEMSTILSDIDEIKSALKKAVTKSDLTDIVKSIVREMLEEIKKEMETRVKEIEDVYMRKCGDLQDKIDGIGLEMESLRELNA